MVLMKLRPAPPEQRQATLTTRVSLSHPTLSLSSLKSASPSTTPFSLDIHLRCTSSRRPTQPLTICTAGTAFDTNRPAAASSHLDNLAQGIVPAGFVSTTDPTRRISLGNFRASSARDPANQAANLLDRPVLRGRFVTVPSAESGRNVVLRHALSADRLFAYSDALKSDDLKPGERFRIAVSEQWVGCMWWAWGELDEARKYSGWEKPDGGYFDSVGKPPEDEIERGEWVLGEDPSELFFELEGGGQAELEFVE